MKRKVSKGAVIATITLSLTGCFGPPEPLAVASVTVAPPSNYRETVLDYVRNTFFDPYSIRDAELSELLAFDAGWPHGQLWYACLRLNAKNRMGAYTGRKVHMIAFKDNAIHPGQGASQQSAQYHELNCTYAKWGRFSELEKLSSQ